uniref:Glycolipid transfer protein domain containing 2b n=1 Tax=Cynoglossus semilaevis TaxID=244447 RepID=A0A3P8WN20_CYNSE
MGVKRKAAAAVLVLLLFLGSLWLREWTHTHTHTHTLSVYRVVVISISEANGSEGPPVLEGCPGQTFQASLLLSHLLDAPAYDSDVLLQPYLSSWDELVKFMDALGPMVGLISKEIVSKTSIIRQLAAATEEEDPEAELGPAYRSVRSMIWVELDRGTVDFHRQTESGCRTLLRLHRALLWLKLFLEKLAENAVAGGRLRSPSELCREAYKNTLANYHSWFVRRAAELAFIAMPERGFFFKLVCVQDQEELSAVLTRVVRAIEEVYDRTQKALEENHMLDLP